jgi:cytochrome c biogenesis protein CcmG, thiol:disulfide interchange protein DsbE
MNRTVSLALCCLFAVSASFGAEVEKKIWAKSFLNQKAPTLIVEKWLTKEPDRNGKFVLIDFWATWCGPCRKAIPELNALHKKFGDRLVVIGLSDEPEAKVKGMKDPTIQYFSAIDTEARMKNELKVTGIPHVVIIDPKGIVRWEGFPLLDGFELTEKVVEDILAKPVK